MLSVCLLLQLLGIDVSLAERKCLCMSFLMLQNSCQSSGFLDIFAFLYNRFFLLHILSLLNQGRLYLEVVRRTGT